MKIFSADSFDSIKTHDVVKTHLLSLTLRNVWDF